MARCKHPRFRTQFDALCSTGDREGAGSLINVSRSGARPGLGSELPELGAKIRLYIFIQHACPFEWSGEVVRHDGSTFAISYSNLDPRSGDWSMTSPRS